MIDRGQKRRSGRTGSTSCISFPTRHSALRIQTGFSYIALLAAIVIIGISLGSATKYWQSVSARDKEDELLFRGDQYRAAIERYYFAIPGRNQYPQSIEDLLKDGRTPQGKRYLRHQYKDPVTGEDFVEIRDQISRRIVGISSSSDKEPIKQANFPDAYKDFEGKKKYNEWKFQFIAPVQSISGQPRPLPGQPFQPGGPNPVTGQPIKQ